MDRTAAFAKIPSKYHPLADGLAAVGFDWVQIVLLILKVIEEILKRPKTAAPTGHCDEHLKGHLQGTCDAACKTLCSAIAACEAAGCCCHD